MITLVSLKGAKSPDSVPSKWIFECVPSQKGLFPDWPHRHRAYRFLIGYFLTSRHIRRSVSSSLQISQVIRGTLPVTIYGPFLNTVIFMESLSKFDFFSISSTILQPPMCLSFSQFSMAESPIIFNIFKKRL
ncbi:hypothetical protein MSVAZ_1641 [Methanosarcina vacuolata Z-761]|uniref:Uncharacterized protein n=1 Tax=Methanosarcina vacuolata Z-761 TaxID=1434123 RepID=A0A0E3Q5Z5_9EURY|nr:hypothetical protein MSVAZ_1641 [Methanosarcina vacuolata Z-761]